MGKQRNSKSVQRHILFSEIPFAKGEGRKGRSTMQRYTLFHEITCVATQNKVCMQLVVQRHTFPEQKTCVAKSERKACDRYENKYKNANEYKNERTGTRNSKAKEEKGDPHPTPARRTWS